MQRKRVLRSSWILNECNLSCKIVKNRRIIAELHARAKRARGRIPIAKVIYPSQKIWWSRDRPTDRQTVRPHHRHTNAYSHTFSLLWEPKRKLIAHQGCHQLTAVKTGYPLTGITWLYRGLRCRPIKVEYFLKLSADNLLVFKWSQAHVYFF